MNARRRLAQLCALPLVAVGLAAAGQAPATAADYEWTLYSSTGSSVAKLVWRDGSNTLCVKRTGSLGTLYGSVRHPDGGWTTLVVNGDSDCRTVSIREDYYTQFSLRSSLRPGAQATWNGYT